MRWDWVSKGARKAAELGAEYLQHAGLIERLVKLPPEPARHELERALSDMDLRARAGFKLTLAGLILRQQAIASPDAKERLQRLMSLRGVSDSLATSHESSGGRDENVTTATPSSSWNDTAARVRERVSALMNRAGSASGQEIFAALKRELEAHRPQIDATRVAAWEALSRRLTALAARADTAGHSAQDTRKALATLRDAMLDILATPAAAAATPAAPVDRITESRAALEAYLEQSTVEPETLMSLGRVLGDARRAANDFPGDEPGRLDQIDTEFVASGAIVLTRRREAVQRRLAVDFVNTASGHEIATLSPPTRDDRTETLFSGISALSALGLQPSSLLANMVETALVNEREAGRLTPDRQQAFARLAVSLQEVARADDADATADRCWELAGELASLIDDGSSPETPAPDASRSRLDDDETAMKRAQLEQFRAQLERDLAEAKMSPARATAYRAQLSETEAVLRMPQGTERERVLFRSRLRELLDRQLESMEHLQPPAARSVEPRPRVLHQYVGRLQSLLLQELTRFEITPGERETADALGVRALEAVRALEQVPDDGAAYELEREMLRRLAADVRQFQRRHHLMLINPLWASPPIRSEASGIFCAGAADLLDTIGVLAAERQLKQLRPGASGKDPAQDTWNRLRSAAVAVFDLREHAPFEEHGDLARAARVGAICYALGIAYCLGLPALVVADHDQQIPFDLDLTPVRLTGAPSAELETLGEAIDEAFYGTQRVSTGDGVAATWEYLLRRWGAGSQIQKMADTVRQMKEEAGADAIVSARLMEYAASLIQTDPPRVVYPVLPGRYPDGAAPRCFVVMPFRDRAEAGYQMVVDECEKAAVEAVRGDATADQQIVRSIWEELCRATHVTVDLTDFNPNVCLELGIADTLGRATLLIGRSGIQTKLFPSIAKRRCHTYSGNAGGDRGVREAIGRFLGS